MTSESGLPSLWQRLKHDVAFRAATLYAGGSWFLVEALDTLQLPPDLIQRTAIVLAALFLPVVAAAFLWQRRRTRAAAAPAGPAIRERPGVRRWALALTSLVVIALGMWAFGTRVSGDVPAAAERIAVMPFHATGSADVRELGVGMVDLLTAALSDVGPIRTVSSRAVLARVGSDAGALSLDALRAAARDVGAASILTGSITAFENRVQLAAELRDVTSGDVIAATEIRGEQGDMMELTDRLAVALLRELWRSRTPMPSIRTAALTTEVPAALRAWLRGEQHLRDTQFDSAAHYFEAAVAADSTFSLAWARLAETVGWAADLSEATIVRQREYMARALTASDRLPDRERALLRGIELRFRGSFAAFDSLDAYVRRYPDDALGWYHLGDARFHSQYLGRFEEAEIIDPFLEATRLDPMFGIGLAHVIDISIARDDRDLFENTLPLYARFGDSDRVDFYRSLSRLNWAPPDSVLAVLGAELRALELPAQRNRVLRFVGNIGQRVRLDVEMDPAQYLAAADTIAAVFPDDRAFRIASHNRRAWLYNGTGRLQAELDALESVLSAGGGPPGLPPTVARAVMRVHAVLGARGPVSAAAEDAAFLEDQLGDFPPFVAGALVFYYARAGMEERVRTLIPILENARFPGDVREVDDEALNRTLQGWIEVMLGDTIGGLRMLEDGVDRLGYQDANYLGLPWEEYGAILTRIPGRERQGIRMMREHIRVSAPGTGLVYLDMARALDRLGERTEAREAYGHALRFLRESDPVHAGRVREIEDALVRLAGEAVR
jgi:TolB-like protein/tetratricopeptide (TPR) repeat protein